jgi:hypothetical protein
MKLVCLAKWKVRYLIHPIADLSIRDRALNRVMVHQIE